MRDAMGGTVVLVIIVVFIVVVSGYLAFNVNYMKAFKMKDKIISYYDEYNGECDSSCEQKIDNYAKSIGYRPSELNCKSGYTTGGYAGVKYYCVKSLDKNKSSSDDDEIKGEKITAKYYKIETKIDISLPGFDTVFDFGAFRVTGDTKVYETKY